MKRREFILGTFGAIVLGGCSSKLNFYTLSPTIPKPKGVQKLKKRVIGIAEVTIPDYLNKQEIITKSSDNSLKLNEKNLWAGSLAKNIQNVLKEDLTALLPNNTFLSYPWNEPLIDKYRIYLTLNRFDKENNFIVMEGHWSIIDQDSNKLVTGERFNWQEPIEISDKKDEFQKIAHAQSRLLEKLSREIASKIRSYL